MNNERFKRSGWSFDIVEVGAEGAPLTQAAVVEAATAVTKAEPGFYLILRLGSRSKRAKGSHVRCFGPFASAKPARALLTTALQWGLVDLDPVPEIVPREPARPSYAPSLRAASAGGERATRAYCTL